MGPALLFLLLMLPALVFLIACRWILVAPSADELKRKAIAAIVLPDAYVHRVGEAVTWCGPIRVRG